jgi:hypothetical protein
MKTITYILLFNSFIFSVLFVAAQPTNCTETLDFTWKDASANGFVWPISNGESSVSRTYSKTGVNGTETIRVILSNPNGKNIDFSNCGTDGNHFYTATYADPNGTQDCGPGTDGQFSYGPGYLTFGMTSDNSNDYVSITFIFSYPVKISNLDLWDIDYQGGNGKGSWEDEIDISATYANMPVSVTASSIGSSVIVSGNNTTALNIRSQYGPGNGNLAHTDAAGSVVLSTNTLVSTLTITYSNGPNDDGESDDHAIKIGSFQMCPNFSIAPLPVSAPVINGFRKGNDVSLFWNTVNVQGVQKYEVEYGEDGIRFSTIHTSYSVTDNSRFDHNGAFVQAKNRAYYRLKVIGNDGSIAYSPIIYIAGSINTGAANVYPNPVLSNQQLVIAKRGIKTVTIYRSDGLIILQRQYQGADLVTIFAADLHTKGMMLVSVNGESYSKLMVY